MKYLLNIKFALLTTFTIILICIYFLFHAGNATVCRIRTNDLRMEAASNSIYNFYLAHNRLPTTLFELTKCPYNKLNCSSTESLVDAWGYPFIYHHLELQATNPGTFKLISVGPDGKKGGDGENADMIKTYDSLIKNNA